MSVRILVGDCREMLRTLPDESVHCCVTSPPYFGLRSYLPEGHPEKHLEIGLEATPDRYVTEMVAVFREVRRVLRPDGTLWLNIGDSYASSTKGSGGHNPKQDRNVGSWMSDRRWRIADGLKPKDLIGIPWLLAFALRADGWWLRSEIIWHKVAPMPESVRDRPTRAHEQVFLLSKGPTYFYDRKAARDPLRDTSVARLSQPAYDEQRGSDRANGGAKTNGTMRAVAAHFSGRNKSQINDQTRLASGNEWSQAPEDGANWRDVWSFASEGFTGPHFAVMPSILAERCIRAGSPPGGVVLDPFLGSGTTALVADRLGRDAIGIDLEPGSAAMARRRIEADAGLFAEVAAQ